MKKLISMFFALVMIFTLTAPVFADDDELVTTDMTVVGCRYDEENGLYELAISFRSSHYATYDNEYRWYYTTSNVSWDIDKSRLALYSDGSEAGDAALNAVCNYEPIPLGTVIEVLWSGLVFEEYPPDLFGVVSFTFTDRHTDYSYDDIISELSNMNEFRDDSVKYPVSEKEDMAYAPRADFTVVYTNTQNVTDGEYHKDGASFFLTLNGGLGDLYSVSPNFGKQAVICDQGDEKAVELYNHFLKTGNLPQGTVIEIVWSGMILDTYPAQLEGVFEYKITSKQSAFVTEKLNEIYNNYADEFELDRLGETVSSSSSGDYPAEIMHDNTVYVLVGEMSGDVADEAIIGYTTSYTDSTPHHEGETNFSRETGLKYANAELNGVSGIAVHYEGSWHFFKPVYDMAPAAPTDDNPKTGTSHIFASIALAGILAWAAAVTTAKRR